MSLIVFEDEHLLVVNKPPGMNTHSPSPYSGEGIYEWLRNRESRWANLAIVHRLDKETSGLLLFTKTPLANRSLTEQFTQRLVRKTYVLATDRPVAMAGAVAKSAIERAGPRYVSRSPGRGADDAETRFQVDDRRDGMTFLIAQPVTGRTHQIRVHAADLGFPILGDVLYGGTRAGRLWLHAQRIRFKHPASGDEMEIDARPDFNRPPWRAIRDSIVEPNQTDAYRLIHGAGDGQRGWYLDRAGAYCLSESERDWSSMASELVDSTLGLLDVRGVYHKRLSREIGRQRATESSPVHVRGELAPPTFVIRENGVRFELSFVEGYSVGLFFDQRDNRRRFLTRYVAPEFPLPNRENERVLNAFSYTCGFSVCAALAGAHVTSLDLSKKYLEWGRRNFRVNNLDPAAHDFIYGDAFDWLRRFEKKGRRFDVIVLDPPTFSRTKDRGVFRAESDYGKLVEAALPLLDSGGVLFASTNAARMAPEHFMGVVEHAIHARGRQLVQHHYQPQPPDFPINREEPGHLKTIWARVD